MSDPNPTRLMVYVGMSLDNKMKKHHIFIEVEGDWQDRTAPILHTKENMWYSKRFGRGIGEVFRVEYKKDSPGTTIFGTAQTVGWYDDKTRMKWQALTRGEEVLYEVSRQRKKEEKRDLLEEHLGPLKLAYWGMRTRVQRAAFLARINIYITEGLQ